MKQIIKFRAWENNNRMRYESDFWQRCDLGNYLHSIGVFKDVKIMQFTGLTDKNGKEIYEGDIFHKGSGRVVWKEGSCQFVLEGKDWENPLKLYTDHEIIGNIYENPELIK